MALLVWCAKDHPATDYNKIIYVWMLGNLVHHSMLWSTERQRKRFVILWSIAVVASQCRTRYRAPTDTQSAWGSPGAIHPDKPTWTGAASPSQSQRPGAYYSTMWSMSALLHKTRDRRSVARPWIYKRIYTHKEDKRQTARANALSTHVVSRTCTDLRVTLFPVSFCRPHRVCWALS